MNRFDYALALIVATTAGLCSISAAPAAAAPIVVKECFVIAPRALSHKPQGTQIDYINKSRHTAKSVTFAVGYRTSSSHYLRKVTDVGSFAPGAEIRHKFDLYNDVTYAGKQTRGCAPISVVYKDGIRWIAR
jgi:hypothetical protein